MNESGNDGVIFEKNLSIELVGIEFEISIKHSFNNIVNKHVGVS